jgi:hypothetical protein
MSQPPPPFSPFPPLPWHATPLCTPVLPFIHTDRPPRSTGIPSSSAASHGPSPRHRSKPGRLKSPPPSLFLASSASGHPSSPSILFEPQIDRLTLSPSRGDLLDHRRPPWLPSSTGAASLLVSPPPSPSPCLPSASPCLPPHRPVHHVTPEVPPELWATTATHAPVTSVPPRGWGAW